VSGVISLGQVLTLRTSETVAPGCVYAVAGVYGFGRGLISRDTIHGFETKYKTLTRLHEGDVVFSKLKAFEGAITVVPREGDGRYVSQEFPVFAVSERLNSRYLDHVLKSPGFLRKLASRSTGIGARRERVHPAQLLEMLVPVPSRSDQDRIAAHLDSLARVATARPPALGSILRRDWHGDTAQVGDLLTPVPRVRAAEPEIAYELSGVKWYGQGMFVRETKKGSELSAKTVRRVESGDLVYDRLFAWKQSFALASQAAWASNEFPTFSINTARILPRVLLAALLGPSFTAAVNDASTGSTPTSRNRLKESDFLRLSVTIPERAEQPLIERLLLAADHASILQEHASTLASAVLPAARNEIFNSLA
jgi:type I restriction enzyme S subunit